jgi:hypothetical protein
VNDDYSGLIRDLVNRAVILLNNNPAVAEHWRSQMLPEWVNETLPKIVPAEFIAWIRSNKEYSFVYDDAAGKVCGKLREITTHLLTELVKELVAETLEQ